jgi:hypothetical protein
MIGHSSRIVVACIAWLLACPLHALADDAQLQNGTLIVTISTPMIGQKPDHWYLSITLEVRRMDRTDRERIDDATNNWMSSDKNDFVGPDEAGIVKTRSLTPGDWEVYSFFVTDQLGNIFSVKDDFSIPFTIRTGRATYVGDFKAVGTTIKNIFGMTMPGGARMVVTDKSARDLAIAQSKSPSLGPVDVTVFNVDTLSNSSLSAHDEPPTPATSDKAPPHL